MYVKHRTFVQRTWTLSLLIQLSLIMVAAVVPQAEAVAGEPTNYALSLDGVNDYIGVPAHGTAGLEYHDVVSMNLWVKLTGEPPVDGGTILSYEVGYYIWVIPDGFQLYECGSMLTADSDMPASYYINKWVMLTAVLVNSTYIRLFVNGTLTESTPISNQLSHDVVDPFELGATFETLYMGKLVISEFQFYHRELGIAEVSQLYNNGFGTYAPVNQADLVRWYKFDEGTGSGAWAIKDRSSDKKHAANMGATWVGDTSQPPNDWLEVAPLYVQSDYLGNITSAVYSDDKLVYTVYASSSATTKVYCGDLGEPTTVDRVETKTYDEATNILTVTTAHSSSSVAVTVTWNSIPVGVLLSVEVLALVGAVVVGAALLRRRKRKRRLGNSSLGRQRQDKGKFPFLEETDYEIEYPRIEILIPETVAYRMELIR